MHASRPDLLQFDFEYIYGNQENDPDTPKVCRAFVALMHFVHQDHLIPASVCQGSWPRTIS